MPWCDGQGWCTKGTHCRSRRKNSAACPTLEVLTCWVATAFDAKVGVNGKIMKNMKGVVEDGTGEHAFCVQS